VLCSLPPKYKNSSQFPTIDSHCFSNKAFNCAKFCNIIETDTSLDLITDNILSKSSGKLTLANSSITKCTCIGKLPPYL